MNSKFNSFLWNCSGAVIPILNKCETDQAKYSAFGIAVLFTGLIASISCGYAIFIGFNNLLAAVAFGIIWGLMIINLDRLIIQGIRKKKGARIEIFSAILRIFFAILLSFSFSLPLELKFFEKEIIVEMQTTYSAEAKSYIDNGVSGEKLKDIDNKINALKNETLTYKQERDSSSDIRMTELGGEQIITKHKDGTERRIGSGKYGSGLIFNEKDKIFNEKNRAYNSIKEKNGKQLINLQDQRKKIQEERFKSIKDREVALLENQSGFLARLKALDALEKKDGGWVVNCFSWLIRLIIISLETSPILLKLLSPRSSYDEILETSEHIVREFEQKSREASSTIAVREREQFLTKNETFLKFELEQFNQAIENSKTDFQVKNAIKKLSSSLANRFEMRTESHLQSGSVLSDIIRNDVQTSSLSSFSMIKLEDLAKAESDKNISQPENKTYQENENRDSENVETVPYAVLPQLTSQQKKIAKAGLLGSLGFGAGLNFHSIINWFEQGAEATKHLGSIFDFFVKVFKTFVGF